MDATLGEKPPPGSTDLDGWRQAIDDGRLSTFRLEALVAALQDLGLTTDSKVRNALAKHLSDATLKMLQKRVGLNHANEPAILLLNPEVAAHAMRLVLAA
jgi:hypothetical protein